MASIAFEYLALALEAAHGTAITPPTHYMNIAGMLDPHTERYRPNESRGTLAEFYRSALARKWSEFSGDGPLDVNTLPVLLNMAVKAVTAPTTPGGATNARLWTFTPTMTADNLKSATIYWGDPNVQIWQAAYAMMNDLTISNDASSTDGATVSISGQGLFPAQVAAPALPAQSNGEIIIGAHMQVWLDTVSAIGTTELTGRVISCEHRIPSGVTYKWLAQGTGATLGYTIHGRAKRHAETTIRMELFDTAQYDIFAAGTVAKLRVRHNGPLIEGALYNYVEVDTYGPLDFGGWGEFEGSNRTIEMVIQSEYDTTLGADFSVKVQNARTTL